MNGGEAHVCVFGRDERLGSASDATSDAASNPALGPPSDWASGPPLDSKLDPMQESPLEEGAPRWIQAYGERTEHPLWLGTALSVLSAVLLTLTMPAYLDAPGLGWVALVPLLLSFELFPKAKLELFTWPFGLLWSMAVHNWYVSIFGPWGVFLIIGAGIWYGTVVGLGVRLQRGLTGLWRLLALPVVWSALEFLKFIAPVVRDWWFVLFAKSQWGFPAALQVLSVTGFPGLSFLLMLTNVALTAFIVHRWQRNGRVSVQDDAPVQDDVPVRDDVRVRGDVGSAGKPSPWQSVAALSVVVAVVLWGAAIIPEPPQDTFAVVATSDLANGPDIQQYSDMPQGMEGYYADTPEMSQAIFDLNAELTRLAVAERAQRGVVEGMGHGVAEIAFVIWPENEFSDADDASFIDQVKDLARELAVYIVVDTVWRAPTGMHDAALMIGPDGEEVGRQPKVHLFQGEKQFGFTPGTVDGTVFETPYGLVGLGVCYDYHYLDVVRALARGGADIVLMPTDDDMNGNGVFPFYHATDAIFRAVEHRVAFAAAGVNGVSLVVDPYGRTAAMGNVNERTVVTGEVFTVDQRTLYTRLGDWFGWSMVVGAVGLGAVALRGSRS